MPDISFVLASGEELGFEAPEGLSLMQAATGWGVPGIAGECGGQLQCATCHVLVGPDWADRLPPPLPAELEMLDCTAEPRQPGSRLACQIRLDAGLQGLRVQLP